MKKIREILFTIVMIASCGCLLNVNTLASLTQNDDLIETESVSEKEEAAEEEEEERKFKKWLETTLDAYSPSPPSPVLCPIVDRVDSIDEAVENRIQNSLPNVSQEWVISNVVADNDGTVLFCNNFLDHSRVTTYRTNMVDGTMVVDASTYDDLSKVCVSEGQAVKKGQKIGEKKYLNFNPAPDKNMIFYNFYEKFPNLTIDEPDSYTVQTQGRLFIPKPRSSTFSTNGFEGNNLKSLIIKPYEEWLAEKEKNESEGNFTPPSRFREEGEQATGEQEDDEEGENAWSSPSFATRIELTPEFSCPLQDPLHAISPTVEDENSFIEDFTAQAESDEPDIYDTDNNF